jgi:exonuclease SbcC
MRLANLGARLEDDADKRKKVATNKTMMDTLNRLDALFDEFKTAVLDRVRPSISQYASQLFGRITRGRYELITVDDDFNFRIMDEGETYPIQRFSGGEIDLANLCLRVAISRAIHELAGSASLGFMGFDEIIGSQDDDRRREIFNALQYLQGMFRQVFIISHINEIKEEFPQVLEITESPSGAQARWIRSDHGEAG